jgi:hypothetical protein
MMVRRATSLLGAVLVVGLAPLPAGAVDVQVSNTTALQIYDVAGGQPGLFLTRRRLTERLTLQVAGILPREDEPGYRGPRISASIVLRLDTDFGGSSREINPSSELWFVPGYDPYAVDLMIAEVRVRDLFRGTTDVRAGRLISMDPTGFSAVDGIEVVARLPWHLGLWVQTGVEVAGGQRLSSGGFEVDGVLRMRRDDLYDEDYLEFQEPALRVVAAGGLSLIGFDFLDVDLAYRQGIVPEDGGRTSYQRLAGTASVSAGMFRGALVAGGDIALARMDEVSLELGVQPLSWLLVSLAGRYDAPVFDTDSIFVAFWSDPSLDLELRLRLRPLSGLELGAVGSVRQAGFLEDGGEVFDAEGLGYGGELYGRIRWSWLQAELRGRVGLGFGGRRVGVIARIVATPRGQRLSFDLRGIVLGLRDDLDPGVRQISLGYVVGARYAMTRDAALLFEFEHNANDEVGQQFRFLTLLDLGVWL